MSLVEGMHFDFSESDARAIIQAYSESPNKIADLSAPQFAHNIDHRTYMEWCFNTPWTTHTYYSGEGLNRFVADETHYELERQGFRWNPWQKHFSETGSNGRHISQAYPRTRGNVMKALTERAIEFFIPCKNYLWPADDNPKNLRISLEPWIRQIE